MKEPGHHAELQQAEDVVPHRAVLLTTVISAVVTVVLILIAYVMLRARDAQLGGAARFGDRGLPAPHVQSQVLAEPFGIPDARPGFNARKRAVVDGWGWVDRQRRIVHVPVDIAIDLVLQEAREK